MLTFFLKGTSRIVITIAGIYFPDMALGILEPKNVEHVAGTVYVHEQARRHAEQLYIDENLKRDKTGKIILVPQPSDDPNDPLVRTLMRYIGKHITDRIRRIGQSGSATSSLPSSPLSQSLQPPLHPSLLLIQSSSQVSSSSRSRKQ